MLNADKILLERKYPPISENLEFSIVSRFWILCAEIGPPILSRLPRQIEMHICGSLTRGKGLKELRLYSQTPMKMTPSIVFNFRLDKESAQTRDQ